MRNIDSSIAQINLALAKGHEVTLTKRYEPLRFDRVGTGKKHKDGTMTTIDLLTLMEDMTKAEMQTMNLIRTHIVWEVDPDTSKKTTTGISYLPASVFDIEGFNAVIPRKVFQKGMKLLKDKGLAVKLDRNHYMFHPLALIPTRPMRGQEIWDDAH